MIVQHFVRLVFTLSHTPRNKAIIDMDINIEETFVVGSDTILW